MGNLQFRGQAVAFLVAVSLFVGSLATMMWLGPEHFRERSEDFSWFGKQGGASSEASTEQKLQRAMELLQTNFYKDVNQEQLMNGAINGMVDSLGDPYTVYMNLDETQHFNESIESSFEGIGAEVTLHEGKIKVVTPIKGSPAEAAGLRANDLILSVNGESLEGLQIFEAVKKIRGPKGTQAKLVIERSGVSSPIHMIIVRDKIPIETVYAKMLDNKVGKIEITQFSMNTADHFANELKALEEQGMRALVIDVRNNPGGLLPIVVEILEQFIPKGETLLQVKYREGDAEKIISKGAQKPYPIAVLMNEGSASASEIMAAALRETIGVKLYGVTTFGKGSVQNTFEEEMGDGSNIKITIAQWLTPSGNTIHGTEKQKYKDKGVRPDVEVRQPAFYEVAPVAAEKPIVFDTVSDEVKYVQMMMAGIGLHDGRQDGYFDARTVDSVKQFQRAKKLIATGDVDSKTAEKLEEAVIDFIRDEKNDVQLTRVLKDLQEQIK